VQDQGSQNPAPQLQVEALRKHYGAVEALKSVSFALEAGQFTALLGPNGAGKSTLFQLLSGVFAADSGSVTVAGISLTKSASAALAKLGIVFQQQSLDLSMSVEQNLRFHAALHGLTRAQTHEAIQTRLTQFGLTADRGRLVRELSGGNRRKVELARALLHQPLVLLADEATVGLDPASRQSLLREIRGSIARDNTTVLWATHLVEEAAIADRVLVLHQGKILADGTPDAVRLALGGETLEQGFILATASKRN
jgi:ABC-2 type transport system ATP-binding protein